MNGHVTGNQQLLRGVAAAAGVLAGVIGLIGFVVAIQYTWGGPHDAFVGSPLAWFVALFAILAAGAGLLAIWRPTMAALAMLGVAMAYLIAVSGSLDGFWSDLQAAFGSGSAMSDFASNDGSMIAILSAVVLLIVGAICAFAGAGLKLTSGARPTPVPS